MKRLYTYFMTSIVLLYAVPSFAQRDYSNVQIQSQHVAGNVHMLQGAGGNIGVTVGDDGILIIDDQYAPLAEKIQKALNDFNKGELQFVLNTHFHGDHTGGNEIFGKSAPIIAHTNNRKRIIDRGRPKEAWPVVTFDDRLSVHFNGEEIKAVHFPHSHTDGDLIIFFTQSNVIHMGDTFFYDRFPYVDIPAGGNVLGLMETIGTLLETADANAKIIPGHGPLASKGDLKRYHDMIVECVNIVKNKMKEGKGRQAIASEGLPSIFESWGSGWIKADQWIGFIYDSILK